MAKVQLTLAVEHVPQAQMCNKHNDTTNSPHTDKHEAGQSLDDTSKSERWQIKKKKWNYTRRNPEITLTETLKLHSKRSQSTNTIAPLCDSRGGALWNSRVIYSHWLDIFEIKHDT